MEERAFLGVPLSRVLDKQIRENGFKRRSTLGVNTHALTGGVGGTFAIELFPNVPDCSQVALSVYPRQKRGVSRTRSGKSFEIFLAKTTTSVCGKIRTRRTLGRPSPLPRTRVVTLHGIRVSPRVASPGV